MNLAEAAEPTLGCRLNDMETGSVRCLQICFIARESTQVPAKVPEQMSTRKMLKMKRGTTLTERLAEWNRSFETILKP